MLVDNLMRSLQGSQNSLRNYKCLPTGLEVSPLFMTTGIGTVGGFHMHRNLLWSTLMINVGNSV